MAHATWLAAQVIRVVTTVPALGVSQPAMAEVGQYAKSKQLEAELQRILEARGATLQKLQSSPKASCSLAFLFGVA